MSGNEWGTWKVGHQGTPEIGRCPCPCVFAFVSEAHRHFQAARLWWVLTWAPLSGGRTWAGNPDSGAPASALAAWGLSWDFRPISISAGWCGQGGVLREWEEAAGAVRWAWLLLEVGMPGWACAVRSQWVHLIKLTLPVREASFL